MNKKQYCETMQSVGYYSGLDGIEIKGIVNGYNDYVYCVSGAWGGKRKYHRCKIYYPENTKHCPFFRINGNKVLLDDCIRADL